MMLAAGRRLRSAGRLLSTLRVADVSCDSATLEWKPAPGPLDVVRIEYRPTARPRAYNLQTVVGVDRWTLAGLTRGCEYAARVVFDDGTARETLFATTTLARAPASSLDIRVGVIVACEAHAHADKLYVSRVDVGDASGPRTVCSGLASYMPIERLAGRRVVVLCNLPARSMRGVDSHGVLLCAAASDAATGRRAVEPIAPPAHAPPGERVAFEGLENLPPERSAHAAVALWEKCTPELSTDDGGVARYGGRALLASEGPCTSRITGKIG